MLKIIIVFILFSIIAKFPLAFHCYLDTKGILPPTQGEPVLLEHFKTFDCNLMKSQDPKVIFGITICILSKRWPFLQPCMTKQDAKSGLITRNCSPFQKSASGCEKDKHGNTLCYCFADFCNSAQNSCIHSAFMYVTSVFVIHRGFFHWTFFQSGFL